MAGVPAGLLAALRWPRTHSPCCQEGDRACLRIPRPLLAFALPQVGADLRFAGPANQRRGRADSISKILFQHAARTQPIALAQLQVQLGGWPGMVNAGCNRGGWPGVVRAGCGWGGCLGRRVLSMVGHTASVPAHACI